MPFCPLTLTAPKPLPDYAAPAPEVPLKEHLRRRRAELGLTQREAARALGVGLATLRNWERGRAKVGEAHYPKVIRFLGHDPNPVSKSLPEGLRAARRASGLSQKALALRLGLDPSTVRAWEAGRGDMGHSRVRQVLGEFVAACRLPDP